MKTGFLYDPLFLKHNTGQGHPECSERLSTTVYHLKKQPWFDTLIHISAKQAHIEDILSIHDVHYVKRAKEYCRSGNPYLDSIDVSICTDSYDIALVAVGSALQLADKIINKNIDNGFALLRPPGHHAEKGMALGFCLFNNIAILTQYLQTHYDINKIAIIDWDVHHGNGTQHLFEADPTVLYISIHQYPYYPGTGNYTETGIGKGKGTTLNCPMAAGATNKDYQYAFQHYILPKLSQFQPEFILISAGFDAHYADPLGNINLTDDFFAWMTSRLMEQAEQYCNHHIISLLEGGYNLQALANCVSIHLQTLSQQQITIPKKNDESLNYTCTR